MSDVDEATPPALDPWTAARSHFADKSLDELADFAAMTGPTQSMMRRNVAAEIKRRETLALIEAAKATKEAALQSKRSAFWVMWLVIIAATSAVGAATPAIWSGWYSAPSVSARCTGGIIYQKAAADFTRPK